MGAFRRISVVLISVLLASSAVGCAHKRESALKDASTLAHATEQGDMQKTLAEADQHWAKRLDENELKKSIALMSKAVKMPAPGMTDADRKKTLAETYEKLSRAYYLDADSFVRLQSKEDENNDKMMALFEKGVTAAEKAIALRDPKFAAIVAKTPNQWRTAVTSADPSAVPALYWYSTNLGKWALLEGIATILARKDDIKATMDFIEKTDPNYFYGAPYRYFGVYHTKVPIGGGNPKKAKAAFDKSIEIAPKYLATKVLMAESYATLVGDRKLFDKLLNEVIKADPNAIPAIMPENTLEQEKAKRLLAKGDDLFY